MDALAGAAAGTRSRGPPTWRLHPWSPRRRPNERNNLLVKTGCPERLPITACHFVFGFGVLASAQRKKARIEYHGWSEVVQREWGVRPIEPNNITGVTAATRAGPFRPLLNEHSGVGTSQPCAMHKTEAAAMAIQPPGATWRHYNPERGERVLRRAVLARCVITNKTTAAQHGRR